MNKIDTDKKKWPANYAASAARSAAAAVAVAIAAADAAFAIAAADAAYAAAYDDIPASHFSIPKKLIELLEAEN